MLRTVLTDRKVEVGRQLVERLDQLRLSVTAAFWYYFPEPDKWRLIIASPLVRVNGPKSLYQPIQSYLLRLGDRPISLNEVQVVEERDPFVQSVKSAFENIGGISDAQLDQLSDGAVFYRLIGS